MAALQQLSDLFKELESAAQSLDKQRTSLLGEISTLESKRDFLTHTVVDLEKQRGVAKADIADKQLGLQAELDSYQTEIAAAKQELLQVQTNIQVAYSKLQTADEQLADVTVEKNTVIHAKDEIIAAKEAEITELDAVIDTKQLLISEQEAKIAGFKQAVISAESEAKQHVANIQLAREVATADLETLRTDVATERDILSGLQDKTDAAKAKELDLKLRISEFDTYKERAESALQAREDALLEKEKQLEVQIVTSRRRNGVLDKL